MLCFLGKREEVFVGSKQRESEKKKREEKVKRKNGGKNLFHFSLDVDALPLFCLSCSSSFFFFFEVPECRPAPVRSRTSTRSVRSLESPLCVDAYLELDRAAKHAGAESGVGEKREKTPTRHHQDEAMLFSHSFPSFYLSLFSHVPLHLPLSTPHSSAEKRQAESSRIRDKYPDRIPVREFTLVVFRKHQAAFLDSLLSFARSRGKT